MARSGIAKGANKGHITEQRDRPKREAAKKAVLSKRTALAREIVREVVGLSPYERRILDMIKTGGGAADKRIYKFAKRRLGSHKRAIQKREDIKQVNSKQRARQAGVGA